MLEPSDITCSESGIDLKDKAIMGEKALQELLKNSSTLPIITSINLTSVNHDSYINQRGCIGWEELGTHWVLANTKTKKAIEEGNKDNFVFFKYENDYVVLVKVKKDLYDDGSYEKYYNPVTLSTINRMPD